MHSKSQIDNQLKKGIQVYFSVANLNKTNSLDNTFKSNISDTPNPN